MRKLVFLFLVYFSLTNLTEAQVKIGENPENLHDNSILELESTSRALVLTRVTTIQMNTMEPLHGALVYNTEEGCVYYYDSNVWVNLCVAENALNISLVDNLDGSYTFTDSNGDTVDFITPFFSVDNTTNAALPSGLVMTRVANNINFEVGRIIGTEHIQNGTVTAATIATDAVGNQELQDNSVGTAEIINETILPEDIEPSTIGNQVLKTDASGIAVEWGTLDATNITSEDLTATDASITIGSGGTDAVLSATDIAVNVDGTTIEVDATNGLQLADNAVTTPKIIDDAVTTDKIGTAGVADGHKILGTDVLGNPVWQEAADLAPNFGQDVTSTNGSITGIAANAALVAMDLQVNVDGTTIEVDATNGIQIVDGGVTDLKLDKVNIPLSGFGAAAADVDLGTNKLVNVTDPTDPQDAATMNYVDTQVGGINTLADGSIYIGDGTNTAVELPISGDATMANTGALTIANDAVTTIKILDANVTDAKLDKANISLTGFGVPTADLSIGTFKLTNVVDPTAAQDAATMNYVDTQVGGINTLADGSIYIGDGTNTAVELPISGDATMANTGALTIANDAVTTIKILDANVTDAKLDKANISLTGFGVPTADLSIGTFKLTNVVDPTAAQDAATMNYVDTQVAGINTLADGTIYLGDATNTAQEVTMSGDATIDNAGALTIANDAVTTVKILDANVTDAKLDKANISLTGFGVPTADLSIGTFKLTNVVDPTAAQDAATMNYVDTQVAGINTLADGSIYIGDGTNTAVELPISGDATMANTGALTIANDAVTTVKILDNNVTTGKIADGTIVDADVSATAAIAGTKINPNFGTQNVVTTGTLAAGNTSITGTLGVSGQTTINVGANSTTLPTDRGTASQVLTTDGAGVASWVDAANPIPTGTAGSIFYSDGASGLLENNAFLFWDGTNNVLGLGTNTPDTSGNIRLHNIGSTRTGGLINSDGSAATPSYRFDSDPNTGMFWGGAADQLGFSVGGLEALRLSESAINGLEVVSNGSLELTEQLFDEMGSAGNVGDVLTATTTGTEWKAPAVIAMGKLNGGNTIRENGGTVSGAAGAYTITLDSARPTANYIIQLSVEGNNRIYITAQTTTTFSVEIRDLANALVTANWHYTVTDF